MTEPNNQQQQSGEQQQGSQEQSQEQQQSGQQQSGNQQGSQQQETFDRQYVESLRQEAAQHRTQRNQLQQQFDSLRSGLAQALGIEQNDDPQQLQNQLQQTQQQYRRERLQNVVLNTSLQQNADPSLTWAHLYASGALDNIDINAGDFADQIASQVQAAVSANPKLASDYAPGQQGAETGNVGGGSNPANAGDQIPDKNPFKAETRNLTEQGRIINENPVLAKQMMQAAGVPEAQQRRMLTDAALAS